MKLAEILVGFKDTTVLNPPTHCIFQSWMSVTIFETYAQLVAGVSLPLHACWENETHLDVIWSSIGIAFEYVF